MNKESGFYSPYEDDTYISMHDEVDFQMQLYDSILDDIEQHGYDANIYTQNVFDIKEIYEETDYNLEMTGSVLASINGVDVEDIMFDPTFQVYVKIAKDLSDMERGL